MGAAIVEGERAVSNLAELHGRLEPCFGRVELFGIDVATLVHDAQATA